MNDAAIQQAVAHQIQQRLKVLAALDDPTCQGLTRDIDAVASEHFFKTMKRQAVHVFGGQ
ncbi:hypothetical protein D3C80_2222850 [compost metagenome]